MKHVGHFWSTWSVFFVIIWFLNHQLSFPWILLTKWTCLINFVKRFICETILLFHKRRTNIENLSWFDNNWLLPTECMYNFLQIWNVPGQALGNVVAMPITGLVCASKYGWPLIFYIYGSLGIVWCILWIFFGSDNPARHKTISESEKKWLENENLNQTDEHVGIQKLGINILKKCTCLK